MRKILLVNKVVEGLQIKIFVAGATGAINRPLLAELLARGHDAVALTRSPKRAQSLVAQGIEPMIADVFDAASVKARSPTLNRKS